MLKIESIEDIKRLDGEIESRLLEIKGLHPETQALPKTEVIVKSIFGLLNSEEEGGHIIIGFPENEQGEIEWESRTPIIFPCAIHDMNFNPPNFDEYRRHIYQVAHSNTSFYPEDLVTVKRLKDPEKMGYIIVIEVKKSFHRPHHFNRYHYLRCDGYTREMFPQEEEIASKNKHLRIVERDRSLLPSSAASKEDSKQLNRHATSIPTNVPFVKLVPFGNRSKARDVTLIEGAYASLEMVATTELPPKNERELEQLIRKSGLIPFGRCFSSWTSINEHGAVIFQESPEDETKAYNLTQIYKDGRIYGVNTFLLNRERLMEFSEEDYPCIASDAVEEIFEIGFENYCSFVKNHWQWPLPIKFIAKLVGVKDYSLAVPTSNVRSFGNCIKDEIVFEGEINNYDQAAQELLLPFFNRIWDACGLERKIK